MAEMQLMDWPAQQQELIANENERADYEGILADLGALALRTGGMTDVVVDVERAAIAALQALLDAHLVLVLRWLPDSNTFSLESGADANSRLEPGAHFPAQAFAQAADALRSPTSTVVRRTFDDHYEPITPFEKCNVASGMLACIRGEDQPWGLLAAYCSANIGYSTEDLVFVRGIANTIAWAIAYQRAQRTLEHLIDDAPDPVARLDADLRVRYANPALVHASGAPASELLGRPLGELRCLAPQREGLAALLQAVFRGRRERQAELALRTPLGERFYTVRLIPELASDHSVRSVLVVARDDTERKQVAAERALLQHELLDRDRRHEVLVQQLLAEQQRTSEQQVDATLRLEILKQLTAREKDILRLLAGGLTNRQIARRLHLSPGTVRNHLGRVFPKLDAIDRTQAAVRAVELGLIAPEGSTQDVSSDPDELAAEPA